MIMMCIRASRVIRYTRGGVHTCFIRGFLSRYAFGQSITLLSKPRQALTPITPIPACLGNARVSVSAHPENASTHQKGDGCMELDFSGSNWVFRHKTTRELIRGLMVLNICSIDPLVNHSYKLLTSGKWLVGPWILRRLVAPFYNQFVAGDTEEEMGRISQRLAQSNIRLMVAPMLETDLGVDHDAHKYETFLLMLRWKQGKTVRKELEEDRKFNRAQSPAECTGGSETHLSDQAHGTPYSRHIGGSCHILYFTSLVPGTIHTCVSTEYLTLDFTGRVAAVEAVGELMAEAGEAGDEWQPSLTSLHPLNLNPSVAREVLQCLQRLHQLGSACVREDVVLAVDAEFTYTNPAISLLTLAMMKVFNNPAAPPIIWNTYQGYLKAGVEILKEDLRLVESMGDGSVRFGAKIVRGAYLEHERARAAELGYPDPVNDTYEDTGRSYDRMVEVMLDEVSSGRGQHCRQVIVSSHNEASITHAVSVMTRLALNPVSGDVVFGQVYGMADNITIPLAASGLLVYKSVPMGNVNEVLPYLSRRAAENRAVLRGARREKQLLKEELVHRLFTLRSQQ
ncbi:hypothetical protein Pmani_015219 [Petrolisthes manimaculis]|uniref:Proline dehydrogenase n=1 Tax=Petrolisthes manimaculis TaxID=1843537 RepID=A0AAE1PSN8_9EUCA|nr:hypothetical protein Pmani_015219 [Petrolisthes manimaculis]